MHELNQRFSGESTVNGRMLEAKYDAVCVKGGDSSIKATADDLAEAADPVGQVKSFAAPFVPRFHDYVTGESLPDHLVIGKDLQATGALHIIGIACVVAFLLQCIGVPFTCCRICACCCKCYTPCACRQKTPQPKRMIPVLAYVILALAVVVTSILGILNYGKLGQASVDTVCQVYDLRSQTNTYLGNIADKVDDLSTNFQKIPEKVEKAVEGVDDIALALSDLVKSVRSFGKTAYDIGKKEPFKTYPDIKCEVCNTSAKSASTTADNLDTTAKNAVDTLEKVKNLANDAVSTNKAVVENGITTIKGSIEDILKTTGPGLAPRMSEGFMYAEEIKARSQLAGSSSYASWYLVVIATIAGTMMMAFNQVDAELPDDRDGTGLGCVGKIGSFCVGCSWFSTFIAGSFLLILASVFFLVIIIFGATCIIVDDLPNDIRDFQGQYLSNQSVELFDICWNGLGADHFRKAFRIDERLAPLENIGFDQANSTDIAKSFETPELDSLKAEVDGLTVEGSFKFDGAAQNKTRDLCISCCTHEPILLQHCLQKEKKFTDYHTACNINPGNLASCCKQQCDNEVQGIKDDLNAHIADLKSEVANVLSATDKVASEASKFKSDMLEVESLFQPVLDSVDAVIEVAIGTAGDSGNSGCSFIKEQYESMEKIMCTDILGALSTIVVTLYILGFLAGPLCIAGCCINKKCGGHGPIPEESIDLAYAVGKEIEFSNIDDKA